MRETITADTANVTAFTQYAIAGPEKARSPPARIGPTVQATCSTVERSDVACSRSSSPTSVGSPAQTAGRKNPVATPLTAASATIAAGSSTNGSAAKVPARTRSETIISRRRERRSTSGPSVIPITTIGMKSAIRSAASQRPESVRSRMSTDNARAARYVPTADPAVAQKSSAKPRFRRKRDKRRVAPRATRGRYHRRPTGNSARIGRVPTRRDEV